MQMKLQSGGNTYASSQELPLSGVDSDTLVYIRSGWGIIIAGMGGFLLWASLAPLNKGNENDR
jgi:protease secretion system membrane fusion protein